MRRPLGKSPLASMTLPPPLAVPANSPCCPLHLSSYSPGIPPSPSVTRVGHSARLLGSTARERGGCKAPSLLPIRHDAHGRTLDQAEGARPEKPLYSKGIRPRRLHALRPSASGTPSTLPSSYLLFLIYDSTVVVVVAAAAVVVVVIVVVVVVVVIVAVGSRRQHMAFQRPFCADDYPMWTTPPAPHKQEAH